MISDHWSLVAIHYDWYSKNSWIPDLVTIFKDSTYGQLGPTKFWWWLLWVKNPKIDSSAMEYWLSQSLIWLLSVSFISISGQLIRSAWSAYNCLSTYHAWSSKTWLAIAINQKQYYAAFDNVYKLSSIIFCCKGLSRENFQAILADRLMRFNRIYIRLVE